MIPEALYPSRLGTTDSEAVFLAIMGSGIEEDPVTATGKVLKNLCKFVNENEGSEQLRFTSALTNGKDLYAFRFAENDSANSLYFREEEGEIVIASEPFDDLSGWNEVPTAHVLVAKALRPVQMLPFDPVRQIL